MAKTIANPVSPSKVLGRVSEWFRRMEEAGLTLDDLQSPIDDPTMRERLVRFWQAGGYEATQDQKLARAIMGNNYLGIEEVSRHFGVNFTEKQLTKLATIPFSEAVLYEVYNTHVLVAGYPLSILDVGRKAPQGTFYQQLWFDDEPFARNKTVPVQWFLLRKDIVENSTRKDYREQLALLTDEKENPTAREVVYAVVLYYLTTSERLFGRVYVRCSDEFSADEHVVVGYFRDGLSIEHWWDNGRDDNGGLASVRRS